MRDGRDQQYVAALNKQTGETVWKTDLLAENQLDSPVFASPAFVDSTIYVRTDSHLYCLSAEPVRKTD